jgi:hypothetical protein
VVGGIVLRVDPLGASPRSTTSGAGRSPSLREVALAVHGLRVSLTSSWHDVLDSVAADFAWFEAPPAGRADVRIVIERGSPDFDRLGDTTASFVTPRNIVYQAGPLTVVDYFGKAVSVLDRSTGVLTVTGDEAHLVHEAAYQYLLSRLGEHLDRVGLIRLHALALSGASGAVAVMLPSGGGKSTLALRALQDDGARILAEDTPLLDRHGDVHPFPLRIGINATDAERLPPGSVRRIERMEFHPKLALDLDAFRDRVEATPRPLAHLVVGVRSLGRIATLEPLPRRTAVGPLFREAVVGVGVYQGMEFVLQHGLRDVAGKAGTAAMRARCCGAGLRRAKVWRLTLGRDHERNWEALRPLLR